MTYVSVANEKETNIMKKFTSILIVIIITVSMFPVTAQASTFQNDVLEHNRAIFNQLPTDEASLAQFLLPGTKSWFNEVINSNHPDIIAKANEITAGLTSDMDKARAIYNWILENIYYDQNVGDRWFSMNDVEQAEVVKASNVLESKRTVCGGFMTLTTSLLRASGIPATDMWSIWIDISIYGNNGWTGRTGQLNTANDYLNAGLPIYMWTAANIDGRWIIIDTNWDNNNSYRNGIFTKLPPGNKYFDVSIEEVSKERVLRPLILPTINVQNVLTVSRTNILLNDVDLGVVPVMVNGRTMVPMRVIFEALDVEVQWDGQWQTITARTTTIHMIMHIGHNYVNFMDAPSVEIDQPPVIINGSTFVPLRFVGEALGVEVSWVG